VQQSPSSISPAAPPPPPGSPVRSSAGAVAADTLVEIDEIVQKCRTDHERAVEKAAQLIADRLQFSADFTTVCDQIIRPAMQGILERLRQNGGGGIVEDRAEDKSHHWGHRLTLWMSLVDEITGAPRADFHPYLQLDADIDKRSVWVSEGDMWQGRGGNSSGPTDEWQLSEITAARVAEEVLAILRRSVQEGAGDLDAPEAAR
jgi:hypothetical protein